MDYNQGYGYASQGRVSSNARPVGIPAVNSNTHAAAYQPQSTAAYPSASHHYMQQQQQGHGSSGMSVGAGGMLPSQQSSTRMDRNAAINEYVAKQKAAKQNAPLIRKENQRMAETRAMSASRSTKDSPTDEYVDDHSAQGHYDDEWSNPPPAATKQRPASGLQQYRSQQQMMQPQQQQYAQQQQYPQQPDRRQSAGVVSRPSPSAATNGIGTNAMHSSAASVAHTGAGAGAGGPSNADLQKRVSVLEEQIKLLKQQNRIFLSFMQNTEQQLAELRAKADDAQSRLEAVTAAQRDNRQQQPAQRARPMQAQTAGAAQASSPTYDNANSYPNTLSNAAKATVARATGHPHPQQQQQQSSAPLNALGGRSEVDQTFAPLDEEDAAARKERLRSARKKNELLKLREKMKGGAQQETAYREEQYQDDFPPQQLPTNMQPRALNFPSSQQQQQQRQPQMQQSGRRPQQSPPVPAASSPYSDYPSSPADERLPARSMGGSADPFAGGAVPEGADEEVETYPCPNCERRFNAQALEKHIAKQICKQKPRKVFNMAQKRLEDLAQEAREVGIQLPMKQPPKPTGTAAAQAALANASNKATAGGDRPIQGTKQAKWRQDHEKFMAAIRAGKQLQQAMASGVPLSSLPPPPQTREEDDDRTPCPHCGRKFEATVAERHIPHCKNTKNKPKATAASAARLGSSVASATARRR